MDNAERRAQLGAESCISERTSALFDYKSAFQSSVEQVRSEGRYRVFADLKRHRGSFPKADFIRPEATRPITVWCSNDYLGMGQNPKVIAAMHEALDLVGAGSGGTRAQAWRVLHTAGCTGCSYSTSITASPALDWGWLMAQIPSKRME